MGRPRQGCDFSVLEGGRRGRLLAICADALSASEQAAVASLPPRLDGELVRDPSDGDLARICRVNGRTLADSIVIATRPIDLPFALEAGMDMALAGAGYENEAAADRVFGSRSAGGLVEAIRYAAALAADGAGADADANTHATGQPSAGRR